MGDLMYTMVQSAELNELRRLATKYEANKHYIELGKAMEKAFNKNAFLIYDIVEDYDGHIMSYNCDTDLEDVLLWNSIE
jgi:hypothetical protein